MSENNTMLAVSQRRWGYGNGTGLGGWKLSTDVHGGGVRTGGLGLATMDQDQAWWTEVRNGLTWSLKWWTGVTHGGLGVRNGELRLEMVDQVLEMVDCSQKW